MKGLEESERRNHESQKETAAVVVLVVLIASPCSASPWADGVKDWLDSIVKIPLSWMGLSAEDEGEEEPLPSLEPSLDTPTALTQEDGLNPDEPPTEKGGGIDVDG